MAPKLGGIERCRANETVATVRRTGLPPYSADTEQLIALLSVVIENIKHLKLSAMICFVWTRLPAQ